MWSKPAQKPQDLEHQLPFNDEKCHKFDYRATILGKNKAETVQNSFTSAKMRQINQKEVFDKKSMFVLGFDPAIITAKVMHCYLS